MRTREFKNGACPSMAAAVGFAFVSRNRRDTLGANKKCSCGVDAP